MKNLILSLTLTLTTLTSFAGPKHPTNGGDAGGGGSLERLHNPTDFFVRNNSQLIQYLGRIGEIAKHANGEYGHEIEGILKKMYVYYPSTVTNPVDAIRKGDIKFVLRNKCTFLDEDKAAVAYPTAEAKGTICISESAFENRPLDFGEAELFGVVLHELTHFYGLTSSIIDEAKAINIQIFATKLYSNLVVNTMTGYNRNLEDTKTATQKLRSQWRDIGSRFDDLQDEGRKDSRTWDMARVLIEMSLMLKETQKLSTLWKGLPGTPIFKITSKIYDLESLATVPAPNGDGAATYLLQSIMTADRTKTKDYKRLLSYLDQKISEIEKFNKEYIDDQYEKALSICRADDCMQVEQF